jgi:Zn-dependent protease with chaperone function
MVLSFIAALLGVSTLPPDHQAIALRVAGPGRPECRMYHADGGEGPCLPSFALSASGRINGHSRAGHITFTRGATTRLTADEFALLAGHEIAHWYLGHTGEGDAATRRAAELAADRLGAQLACQAGYDVAKGAAVFRFMSKSRVHPERAVRRAVVLAARCGD